MQKIILVDTNSTLLSVRQVADKLNKKYDLSVVERFNCGEEIQSGLNLEFQNKINNINEIQKTFGLYDKGIDCNRIWRANLSDEELNSLYKKISDECTIIR